VADVSSDSGAECAAELATNEGAYAHATTDFVPECVANRGSDSTAERAANEGAYLHNDCVVECAANGGSD